MANIFQRLRKGIKSRRSTSKGESTKIAELEQELSRALNEVHDLQTRLAEHDFMLAHTTSSIPTLAISLFQSDSQSLSDIPRTVSPIDITPTSIDDIWIPSCSGSFLIDAEQRWQDGDPELAMELASGVISQNPFLCELDEVRCRLFIAAVQHYLCQYEESMMGLETVIQINNSDAVLHNPESSIIAGITHFIKGMNFIKLERFPQAYSSFSGVLGIPGYDEKARQFQKEAVIGFARIAATESDHSPTASPTASTHALLDWEDNESS
ncbi:hypothetical protein N7489_000588 [Penicillium chrysogenum]|jgi:hypothetical protein|uniref:Transcription factor n=1 Tax=Penicillium chrysogenum TaxID=5076 RepID=A0ABQ8WGC5_PENCH|nr:uncharacterized protein N7489_000588 [Penicillium chrysogenum]KAJ5250178.1 hypothetical protein N7489_000588 [Penicillium chrysogenum]KAJ5269084.1 hypothetical protein N7505_004842 [Penicillium chrysogenum]